MAGEHDRAAEILYRAASVDTSAAASPLLLAERLLGQGSVRSVNLPSLPGDGALVRVRGNWRIYVQTGIGPTRSRWAILHEIGHWVLGVGAPEDECDSLAAALAAPRSAFALLAGQVGQQYTQLALQFTCSESLAALRYAEVTGSPSALITPHRVRLRGDSWPWPRERDLREIAQCGGPGLRRCRLQDAPDRVVLSASVAA